MIEKHILGSYLNTISIDDVSSRETVCLSLKSFARGFNCDQMHDNASRFMLLNGG